MASIWDNVVASASKAATQAGEATQVAAMKTKLHADLLVIDRDIHARKEKFGVEMYAHLESITSTQEFYVADDRLINVIRPTLIKAQREVAAYERKRDVMRGKVNMAETNRTGSASIFAATTIGEKMLNAAKYAAAGVKEAASKTELAMIERQILGFKEEFGVELYPIFESMEDNEGWLPTDRKVRSLYDSAREDIAKIQKSKEDKREQIKKLDGLDGSGLTPPSVPAEPKPIADAIPVPSINNKNNHQVSFSGTRQTPWASTVPTMTATQSSATNEYGATQMPVQSSFCAFDQNKQFLSPQQPPRNSGFSFIQSEPQNAILTPMPPYANISVPQQQRPAEQPQQQNNLGAVFDPFDTIGGISPAATSNLGSTLSVSAIPSLTEANAFDPFLADNGKQSGKGLSNADLNLFKY